MIEIRTQIHDRYSFELKVGFVAEDRQESSDFNVGFWMFVPSSLDITPNSFTTKEFYRCMKSNVRLKTPEFALSEIASGTALPLKRIVESSPEDLEYRMKIFSGIVKSSMRESMYAIQQEKDETKKKAMAEADLDACSHILESFLSLPEGQAHSLCGEYLCTTTSSHIFHLMDATSCGEKGKKLLHRIYEIRDLKGYPQIEISEKPSNSYFLHRQGVIKKSVESVLFLNTPKKKDGMLAEQVYYSLAAGLAMLFATVVAWAFQHTFGNLTWPLFIALIISYMMKDRIKELMRYYFAHRMNGRYFDQKADISMRGKNIGTLKEAMDFIAQENIPTEVMEIRNSSHIFSGEEHYTSENVILYKKQVHIDRNLMNFPDPYEYDGINDIFRFQVRPFLRKMDNPIIEGRCLDENDNVITVPCEKIYYVNIILQYQYAGKTEYRRFRLALDRDGIRSIDEVQ